MSRWHVGLVLALLSPTTTYAGEALDFTSGQTSALLSTSSGMAWGLLVPSLVLALCLEGLGRSPLEPKDYAGVVYRGVVVLFLLSFYTPLFGGLVRFTEGIAGRLAPADIWQRFGEAQAAWQAKAAEASNAQGGATGAATLMGATLGGFVFDSLLASAVLVGQACHWAMGTMSRLLAALLYAVGPLALAISIPKASGVGARWFRLYATVLTWPLISALLLSLTLEVGLRGMTVEGAAFEALASSLLTTLVALVSPLLAGGLIGGSLPVVGAGLSAAGRYAEWATPALSVFSRRDDSKPAPASPPGRPAGFPTRPRS